MLDTVITVLVNTCERVMLSALVILIMLFLPIAWSAMIYCTGGVVACAVAFMLFTGATFFVYCFMRLLWVDIPLTDSSSLVL